MIEQVINFSIRYRWLVLLATLGVTGLGAYEFQYLPIDAVPDITNVQVQINTAAYGLSAPEIEQRITYPIETAMAGLPSLESTRSLSYYGLSQVTIVFKEETDIYLARQLIAERLREAQEELPDDARPELSPIATGLGEIYLWTVNAQPGARKADGSSYTLMDLREIQDWVIKPRLKNVPGVVEVNSIGGFEKQYHVTPYPDRLVAFRLTFEDLIDALKKNNSNIGAGYIEKNGEQYLIRSPGQVKTLSDIRGIVVSTRDGQAIRVGDVADVIEASELRTGAATRNGEEAVLIANALPLRNEKGEIECALAAFFDVTAHRAAEEALARTEQRMQRLFDSPMIGIFSGDGDLITEANDAFLTIVGYERADLPLNWRTVTPPGFEEQDACVIDQMKERGFCDPFEKEYLTKNGRRVPAH